jgi:hypothetical protein
MNSVPWSGPEYFNIVEEISRIIQEVDPAVVGLDPLFGPGIDATRLLDRRHAIVSPNALKDNFAQMQPSASILWKYPAAGSGYRKSLANVPFQIFFPIWCSAVQL